MAAAASGGEAVLVGSYTWTSDARRFGGFSGLELSPDGARLVAISDRSAYVEADITRKDGRITSVTLTRLNGLRAADGGPYAGDTEGLAVDGDRFFVSLEGPAQVWAYSAPQSAVALTRAPGFGGLQGNSGLEALAIDTRGRLLTLPERSGAITTPFPVWRLDEAGWSQPFAIPRRGGFLPVGASTCWNANSPATASSAACAVSTCPKTR